MKKIIMAGALALALSGCTVSVSGPHLPPLLHSQSYRDGYNTVHSRSGSFTEKDRQQTHDAIASGYWTAQSMCRLIERGQNPQPVEANDWVDGCAAAVHDDLGVQE
jgi:hypothetical protein